MADSGRAPLPYDHLPSVPELDVTSDDISHESRLPDAHVADIMGCTGDNQSPQLQWSGAPEGTQSFAVTCFDPDAPTGSGFWHWAVYDLDPTTTELAADAGNGAAGSLPPGAVTLPNEARSERYIGAAPPATTGVHRYFFVVDALDVSHLDIAPGSTPAVLGFNRHFHSLARGILVATASVD